MIKEKYVQKISETSINVVQTTIDSLKRKEIEKTGLRIYDSGRIGYAGAIGKCDMAVLEERAKDTLKNNIAYTCEPGGNLKVCEDFSSEIIGDAVIADEFESLLSELKQSQPEFDFSHKLKLIEQQVSLINGNGLDLQFRDKYLDLELLFKEKSSVNIMDGFVAFNGRKYDHALILKGINEICDAYKNVVELPKGSRLPVVFITQEELPLLKLIQDLNGNSYGSSSSLLGGKIGQKLFNESFTLYQTNHPEDISIPFFDAEGVINKGYRYTLIENGIVVSPYTDKRTAARYNLPLTGCAAAEYDSVPTLGTPKLKVMESGKTAKELLEGEPAILVMIAAGGDFTPEGNFATPVQLSFLFDGEKPVGRLPELNLSSNVFDMFGDSFRGVSKDTVNPLSFYRYLIMDMKVSK